MEDSVDSASFVRQLVNVRESNAEPSVAVLLAAFDGEKWIREQIESILDQVKVNVRLFISIDPSSDLTEHVCRSIAAGDRRVIVLPIGETFGGAAKNFYRLIKDVDTANFDAVALADQDDIWMVDKMFVALQQMSAGSFDGYSANVTAFWDNGRERLVNKAFSQRKYDHFFEAAGPGCTYVFNQKAFIKIQRFIRDNYENVRQIDRHDWLLYAFARERNLNWFIDPVPRVRYRQHFRNQVGARFGLNSFFKRWIQVRDGWYYDEVLKISNSVIKRSVEFKLCREFIFCNFWEFRRAPIERFYILFVLLIYGKRI